MPVVSTVADRVEQTVSTWGRQCLQTTDRNSHGRQVNGRAMRVNGVAFGVKCAYSCILGAFGPPRGAAPRPGGPVDPLGGGGANRWGGGGKALIYHTHTHTHTHTIYYYIPLPLNLANKQATSNKQQASNKHFRFGHCSASSLRALLYSSHPRA